MNFAHRARRRIAGAAAVGIAALGVILGGAAALGTSGASASGTQDARLASTTGTTRPMVLHLFLAPTPEGTATIGAGRVQLTGLGLTPGSSHAVKVAAADGGTRLLGTLTANSVGQASATFAAHVPGWSQVQVLDGAAGTAPIAETVPLGFGSINGLFAVEDGHPFWGDATVVYRPAAKTVSVTVDAFGLSPGAHAAHIHSGSCASQGPVVHMLTDFTASAAGVINHETRVVTGVTSFPATGWYLNLHQGDSANILDAHGRPTIFFRPLLCADL